MTKADELWEKYASTFESVRPWAVLMRDEDFLAALTEYGEHIKAEAVKVCQKQTNMEIKYGFRLIDKDDCAAAIANMEIK